VKIPKYHPPRQPIRIPIRLRIDVPPLVEIVTVSTAGAWMGWIFGYHAGVVTKYPTPSDYGYWWFAGAGLFTLWMDLYSLSQRVIRAASIPDEVEDEEPEPPHNPADLDSVTGMRIIENSVLTTPELNRWRRWSMSVHSNFEPLDWETFAKMAARIVIGFDFTYRNYCQEISGKRALLTRDEWEHARHVFIRMGWAEFIRKSRPIQFTEGGLYLLKLIAQGSPPPENLRRTSQNRPHNTHAQPHKRF
jgi:hypothetical protein